MPATKLIWTWKIWQDSRGQEMVEWALMAGFLVSACSAMLPDVASSVGVVFSRVVGLLSAAYSGTEPPRN